MSTETPWRRSAGSFGPGKSALRGTASAGAIAAALMLTLASSPAAAQGRYYYSPYYYPPPYARHPHVAHKPQHKEPERVGKAPFADMPKGPLQIFVSIDQQKLHFYSDGVHVEDEPVATGVPGHPTPMGVFSVIQRDRYHHSNIYSNAPMPFMERITWSGVALHEGVGLGHRASHGCIRMPHDFAARLWTLKTMGMRVIIARPELKPSAFADAHLFVHKAPPQPPPQPAAPTAEAVKTAQTADGAKTSDAAGSATIVAQNAKPATDDPPASAPATASAAKTDDLGLRVNAGSAGNDPSATAQNAANPASPVAPDAAATAAAPPAAEGSPAAGANEAVPIPQVKPAAMAASTKPIAIFVSRKTQKLYVRQNFEPLFDAAITIDHPEQPLGTHVFTALAYLDDHTTFRWNVVSLPGEPPPARKARKTEDEDRYDRYGRRHRRVDEDKPAAELPPPQSPAAALARVVIPQDVIDHVSELMVPGSSLVISDQGLGEETGEGTDFIVVTR